MKDAEFQAIVERANLGGGRRWEILKFLEDYERDFSLSPTLREIGNFVGISSTSVVNYSLVPMRDAGLIAGLILPSGNTAPRTLQLTDLGRRVLAHYQESRGGETNDRG